MTMSRRRWQKKLILRIAAVGRPLTDEEPLGCVARSSAMVGQRCSLAGVSFFTKPLAPRMLNRLLIAGGGGWRSV
jgi:hypothetical protein